MAELARRPDTPSIGQTHFPAIDLRIDGRSLHLQRLDAQAAVDRARQQNLAARHALVAASTSVLVKTGPARVAADTATTVLRTSVSFLTAFEAAHGGGIPAALHVDVLVDAASRTTMVRPTARSICSPRRTSSRSATSRSTAHA